MNATVPDAPPRSETVEQQTDEEAIAAYMASLDLPSDDGEPLETIWHRWAMNILIESISWSFRDRTDFFVSGNMFIHYREEPGGRSRFRGPDFFFVWGAKHKWGRKYWFVWEEEGKYPDVIVELTSASTAKDDHTAKKDIYERIFKTAEYFCYDPDKQLLEGWRLVGGRYVPLSLDANGRLESRELGLWLGPWHGDRQGWETTWLRWFDGQGNLLLLDSEDLGIALSAATRDLEAERRLVEAARQQVEAERQRAEAERLRAEAALAELAQLRARLGTTQTNGSTTPSG